MLSGLYCNFAHYLVDKINLSYCTIQMMLKCFLILIMYLWVY